MANQKGAALIVVLSLLVGSLVIGLSSMQSSQVDERLAGNQKLVSEVQMSAEKAAALGFERASDVGLLMPLMRGGCSITDLFIDVNGDPDASPADRIALHWSGIDDWAPDWVTLLEDAVENDEPCMNYKGNWTELSNQYQSEDFPSGYFSDLYGEMLADASGSLCSAPLECAYRFISVGDSRYVVGLARYVKEGKVLAESRPVFVEIDIDDPPPNVEWVFNASPISLLTLIQNLKVAGAQNVNLDGGSGSDITANEGNVDYLLSQFSNNQGFVPELSTVDEDVFGITDLMLVVQSLFEMSDSNDSVMFSTESVSMKDVNMDRGVLVVGGDFDWNGANDFYGVIIVLGPTVHYKGGGAVTGKLYGSLIHAPITVKDQRYDWVEPGQYVDFSKFDEFEADAWRFLAEGDDAETDFDFSGGGGSTLQSDGDAMMDVRDEYWGEVTSAEFITWESD